MDNAYENRIENGLINFLCPIMSENFYIQPLVFDTKNLNLQSKIPIEILDFSNNQHLTLKEKDVAKLELLDPHQAIIEHINNILFSFKQTAFRYAKIRIEYINHNQCKLFHIDNVKLRLVQTLLGRGTEFIDKKFVNYNQLCQGQNETILNTTGVVQTLQPNHFILMKGAKWSPGFQACVHKSPEIEKHKEFRLLVVIDFDDSPFQN